MRRDLVLARKVLAWIEANSLLLGSRKEEIRSGIAVSESSFAAFDYQLDLLVGAGFVVCEKSQTGSNYYQLTWAGHELLDTIDASLP